jgi:hypothetical protein
LKVNYSLLLCLVIGLFIAIPTLASGFELRPLPTSLLFVSHHDRPAHEFRMNLGDRERITHYALSPDKNFIIVATTGGATLYDAETFTLLQTLKDETLIERLSWSPNGAKLCLISQAIPIEIWEESGNVWNRIAVLDHFGWDENWRGDAEWYTRWFKSSSRKFRLGYHYRRNPT